MGLQDAQAQTFVGDVQSPLSESVCAALTSLFEMLWGTPQPAVSTEDWKEYQRLCKATSPDLILNIPDYYGFFTYTVFQGRVVKN